MLSCRHWSEKEANASETKVSRNKTKEVNGKLHS